MVYDEVMKQCFESGQQVVISEPMSVVSRRWSSLSRLRISLLLLQKPSQETEYRTIRTRLYHRERLNAGIRPMVIWIVSNDCKYFWIVSMIPIPFCSCVIRMKPPMNASCPMAIFKVMARSRMLTTTMWFMWQICLPTHMSARRGCWRDYIQSSMWISTKIFEEHSLSVSDIMALKI